tara:strand:+ start:470 stop:1084 length:615 start_codon:yes stop_codon:yes gene_type:complete
MDQELIDFIEYHKLDSDDFYNANGRPVASCYSEMKSKEKLFAYNTTPCSNSGHTLRDRQGHCIVCNTANIAFSLRKKQIGFIYIACSIKKEISKVGMTTEQIKSRLSKLNSRQVGNTNDWEIVYSIKCPKANSVELLIHAELNRYQVKGDLYGNTESKELFRCSYHKVRELVDKVIAENNIKLIEKKSYITNTDKYRFRNLVSN